MFIRLFVLKLTSTFREKNSSMFSFESFCKISKTASGKITGWKRCLIKQIFCNLN